MGKDSKNIIINKNARRNFSLNETFQAGIVLDGWEVKSIRQGKIDLKNSYVRLKNNEAWVIGLKIDVPASLNQEVDIMRSRKLLLKKKEINNLKDSITKKGETCVLEKIYWSQNLVKCDIALGKGKKKFDQREDIKKRDWERDKARAIKKSLRK